MYKLMVMVIAATFFVMPVYAGGGHGGGDENNQTTTVGVESENTNQQSQSMGQSQGFSVEDAFNYEVNNISKDNVSIGSWLHAAGMAPGLPDIPLNYKLAIQQYNEATPGEIFASMPEEVTREHIAAYYVTLKEEMGSWDRGKLNRNINRRSFTWIRDLPVSDSLKVYPGYPNAKDPLNGNYIAKKGIHYKMVARLVFNSEDEIVYREDQAIRTIEWALDKGANAIIVTGFGARRVFATKAGALSLLTAFGQVFTSGWTGAMNISPGGGLSSGSNQTETLPYLRVAAVQILDERQFVLGLLPQEKFDNAAKRAQSKVVEEDLNPLRDEIAQRKTQIAACPTANANNANLRYSQGMAYLNLATKTTDDEERQGSLVGSSDNFGQALRDGMQGDKAMEVNGYLASIWYAMAMEQPEDKRQPYFDKVREFAAKAGIEEVQLLKFNQ